MSKMDKRDYFENSWDNGQRIRDLEQQIDSLRESIHRIASESFAAPAPVPPQPAPSATPSSNDGHQNFSGGMIGFAVDQHPTADHSRPASDDPAASGNLVRAARVRERIRQRRTRESLFNNDIFADPAWDMLLDLYAAELEGGDVSVSSLCIAATVPTTTALRWIKMLSDQGWLVRQQDPCDGRRINMRLSDAARTRLNRYFDGLKI